MQFRVNNSKILILRDFVDQEDRFRNGIFNLCAVINCVANIILKVSPQRSINGGGIQINSILFVQKYYETGICCENFFKSLFQLFKAEKLVALIYFKSTTRRTKGYGHIFIQLFDCLFIYKIVYIIR